MVLFLLSLNHRAPLSTLPSEVENAEGDGEAAEDDGVQPANGQFVFNTARRFRHVAYSGLFGKQKPPNKGSGVRSAKRDAAILRGGSFTKTL